MGLAAYQIVLFCPDCPWSVSVPGYVGDELGSLHATAQAVRRRHVQEVHGCPECGGVGWLDPDRLVECPTCRSRALERMEEG